MLSLDLLAAIATIGVAAPAAIKAAIDAIVSRRKERQVLEAEKVAFKVGSSSSRGSNKETLAAAAVPESAQQFGNLFDLYNKQIERYQSQTLARAGWSFIFAIFSMFAGLGFIVAGGAYLIVAVGWEHVAAGTAIAAIGGSVSAYITKTFLDVHRLSLAQLNHYFRQPLVSTHVLTAQRIADHLHDAERQSAYGKILVSVLALIADPAGADDLSSAAAPRATAPRKKALREVNK